MAPDAQSPDIACRIYNATRPTDWTVAIDIAERDDDRNFAAIGIHPWYVADAYADFATEMANILATHPNIMVGEIGLDKFHPDMPRQIEIFTRQLEIAHKFNRPICMHCVGAWDKILHIFHEHERAMPPAVLTHAFAGDAGQIQMMADRYNMYFSYATPHDGGKDTERISTTPTGRILTETDTFDSMTELDELDSIVHIIANLHGIDADEMSEQIYQNIQRIISYVRPIA